ncbi:MAG TPA: hypothetical protein VIY73_14680 [Polyangiaceae bacterium]
MMAARKKSAVKRVSGNGHAFAVVVEQLRSDFRVFGEALAGLDAKVSGLEARMDQRFDRIEQRLERVECDVSLLKTATTDNGRELKAIRTTLDRKVDRDEVEGIVARVVARPGR